MVWEDSIVNYKWNFPSQCHKPPSRGLKIIGYGVMCKITGISRIISYQSYHMEGLNRPVLIERSSGIPWTLLEPSTRGDDPSESFCGFEILPGIPIILCQPQKDINTRIQPRTVRLGVRTGGIYVVANWRTGVLVVCIWLGQKLKT